uniref:Uncharacterized protein n=1 Tax=Theileria annulata TaxID=5874 RepID=A0A3B0N0X7_THEAN
MRISFLRYAKKAVSQPLSNKPMPGSVSEPVSSYEKFCPLATPTHVEGIWRAPRSQGFTKEQFDRAYPDSYKGMKIGLPTPGTFAADHVDPKFDEISPLVWTCILMSPLIVWAIYEFKEEHFPSKTEHH